MLTIEEYAGVDSGTPNTVTAKLDIGGCPLVSFWAKEATGDITDAVITLQCSPDGDDWYDTAHLVTFTDRNAKSQTNKTVIARFIRFKITTKSTAASTCDIDTNAK